MLPCNHLATKVRASQHFRMGQARKRTFSRSFDICLRESTLSSAIDQQLRGLLAVAVCTDCRILEDVMMFVVAVLSVVLKVHLRDTLSAVAVQSTRGTSLSCTEIAQISSIKSASCGSFSSEMGS